MLAVLSVSVGLVVPVLPVARPYLPLATPTLALSRAVYDQIVEHSRGGPQLVGLECALPGERTSGLLCEMSAAAREDECAGVRVRLVGFSRYSHLHTAAPRPADDERPHGASSPDHIDGTALPPLAVAEVAPFHDLEPEDCEALRERYDLTSRRPALAALEKRVHLAFQQSEQLLAWLPAYAASATMAVLGDDDHAERNSAVRRFAPPSVGRASSEREPDGPGGVEEGCDVEAVSDECMLERAYLHASAWGSGERGSDERPAETKGTGAGVSAGHSALEGPAAFTCSRAELHSFALARSLDLTHSEAGELLAGRSTLLRLELAAVHLERTNKWLMTRGGLAEPERTLAHAGHDSDQRGGAGRGVLGSAVRALRGLWA